MIGSPFQYFMIDPVTNWSRFFNFTINNNYDDHEIEEYVLRRVGSYGKQIGKMMDVIEILLDALPQDRLDNLTEQQKRKIRALQVLYHNVEDAKEHYKDVHYHQSNK